ncbi:hypothetical protein C8T65DRAFT_52732 [Cerioporus squamosus]|nr:hypothetical protein C8T65DRAFT_52732 [Cerioporus squamosus]
MRSTYAPGTGACRLSYVLTMPVLRSSQLPPIPTKLLGCVIVAGTTGETLTARNVRNAPHRLKRDQNCQAGRTSTVARSPSFGSCSPEVPMISKSSAIPYRTRWCALKVHHRSRTCQLGDDAQLSGWLCHAKPLREKRLARLSWADVDGRRLDKKPITIMVMPHVDCRILTPLDSAAISRTSQPTAWEQVRPMYQHLVQWLTGLTEL